MKINENPMHWQRIRFLRKRLKCGKSDDEIVSEIKDLQWFDFNESVTRRQIKFAREMY